MQYFSICSFPSWCADVKCPQMALLFDKWWEVFPSQISVSENLTYLTVRWEFFLIHYLNVRVCLIRIHTFRHFCEHDKYFVCHYEESVAVTQHCIFCSWRVCVFILNVFCNSYNPVKWQAWRNRDFASSFVLSLRNHILRFFNFLNLAFIMTPWAEYELFVWFLFFTSDPSPVDLEHSGHPLLSQTEENEEKLSTHPWRKRHTINNVHIILDQSHVAC